MEQIGTFLFCRTFTFTLQILFSFSSSSNEFLVTSSTQHSRRRKIAFHPTLGYAVPPVQPAKVERRNLRERNRVKQVNCGFEVLKSHIPSAAKHKKMSKVETLRHAVEYIENLQAMLDKQDGSDCSTSLTKHVFEFEKNLDSQHVDADSVASSTPSPKAEPKDEFNPAERSRGVASPAASEVTTMTVMQPPQPQQYHGGMYPSAGPLTPGTPDYSTASFGNESGYETSSYYSTSTAQRPQHPQHVDHHQHPHQHQQHPPQWSPPVHQQQAQGFYPAMSTTTGGRIPTAYYENSEEDDLLDAIVNWEDK